MYIGGGFPPSVKFSFRFFEGFPPQSETFSAIVFVSAVVYIVRDARGEFDQVVPPCMQYRHGNDDQMGTRYRIPDIRTR